jgi:hypothetical protein
MRPLWPLFYDESILRVLIVREEEDALFEKGLCLLVGCGALLFLRQDVTYHLQQLGHAVGQSHQSQFVQLLKGTANVRA